jgi:succinate-semialdehyde dehydrogenase/glutarate-semialdehyde dehydrogenase
MDVSTVIYQPAARRTRHQSRPVGAIVVITNWCQPALTVARKVAPALAAGCTVILKPSARAPLTSLTLAELWDDAGGNPGTLQVLTTEDPIAASDVFLSDSRVCKVTFIGSKDVGQHLARKCTAAGIPVALEVDGQAPLIVLADADLERAAEAIVRCTFLRNAGPDCTSANRIYAHENIAENLLKLVAAKVSALRCGDPLDPATQVGPLVDSAAVITAAEHIADALDGEARIVIGGTRTRGLHFAPTVLDKARPEMRVATEGRSGPIVPVFRFREVEDVIDLANASRTGSSAWLWVGDMEAAYRLADDLDYRSVWVNDPGASTLSVSTTQGEEVAASIPTSCDFGPYLKSTWVSTRRVAAQSYQEQQ